MARVTVKKEYLNLFKNQKAKKIPRNKGKRRGIVRVKNSFLIISTEIRLQDVPLLYLFSLLDYGGGLVVDRLCVVSHWGVSLVKRGVSIDGA